MGELAAREHRAGIVDQARRRRVKHEPADRIGEPAAGHAEAVLLGLLRAIGVGRQEDLERRAVRHLRVERSRRAEAEHRGVAGRFLERGGDILGRLGEVGGDGNLGFRRERGRRDEIVVRSEARAQRQG